MGIFNKLSNLFAPKGDTYGYWVVVKCNQCGEIIKTRVDLRNDLSLRYDEQGKSTYYCRKVLVGDQHCFQKVEIQLTFDVKRKLVDRQISGGEFVDEQE
ncbi:MAG: hypothetical protein U9R58_04600 [Chloroflexota bacterium]|nr:hypothetical protein [Chloroflexota bacterium]